MAQAFDWQHWHNLPRHKQGLKQGRWGITCEVCGLYFGSPRKDKRFCSDKCKQKAYRVSHGHAGSYHEAAVRGAETKAAQVHTLVCENCGREYWRDGRAAPLHRYCSNACKQAAYRKRKTAEK